MSILFVFWTISAVLSLLLLVGLLVLVYEAIGALRAYKLEHGSTEGDHDERIYDLTGLGQDGRGALALMLTGAAIPHRWEGDVLVVPHLREAEVDELIDSIEE